LERADGGEKTTATVQVIDYEANLAILRSTDRNSSRHATVQTTVDVKTGDDLSSCNWNPMESGFHEGVGDDRRSGKYALEDSGYLMFRISCRCNSGKTVLTLPIVKENKLAGF